MQVFFDIRHEGELHLDKEAQEFVSIKAACDYLADTLSDFEAQPGGRVEAVAASAASIPGVRDNRGVVVVQ